MDTISPPPSESQLAAIEAEASESENVSLPQYLAHLARNTWDGGLALCSAAGLVLAAGSGVAQPEGWMVIASAGACLAAFGLWGIADRELSERRPNIGPVGSGLLRVARVVTAALGAIAGLLLIFGAAALTLGTWIS